jgi:hypothetical protein
MHRHATLSVLALLALAPLGSAQGALWTVDDDGAADFREIQPAVDAAADGDVILVRAGAYASFTLDGRSLAVLGEEGGEVLILHGSITVRHVAPGQSVLLRGLDVAAGFAADTSSFVDCAGPVWVEDCDFQTQNGDSPEALRVSGCEAIAFIRCSTAPAMGSSSGAGLVLADGALGTRVALYDAVLAGRDGALGGGDGGSGVEQAGGFLFASGSQLLGGDGGKGILFTPPSGVQQCTDGGDGGDGLRVSGPTAQVRLLDSPALAGGSGTAALTCTPGVPGSDIVAAPGVVSQLPGAALSFVVDAIGCEGELVIVQAQGQPFELLLLGWSLAPAFAWAPAHAGVLLLDAPELFALGPLSATGDLSASLHVPRLPASAPEAVLVWLQAVGAQGARLGSPSALAVVRQASCP